MKPFSSLVPGTISSMKPFGPVKPRPVPAPTPKKKA